MVGHDYAKNSNNRIRLVPQRKDFVPPQQGSSGSGPPRPLEEGKHGRCRVVDLDEVSGSILKSVSPLRVKSVPLRFNLDPSSANPDRIVVAGLHPAVGQHFSGLETKLGDPTAKSIAAQKAAAAAAKAKAKAKASAPPPTAAGGCKRSLLEELKSFRAPPVAPPSDEVVEDEETPLVEPAPGAPELAQPGDKKRRTREKKRQKSDEIKESLLELLQDMDDASKADLCTLIEEDVDEESKKTQRLQKRLDEHDREWHFDNGPRPGG